MSDDEVNKIIAEYMGIKITEAPGDQWFSYNSCIH